MDPDSHNHLSLTKHLHPRSHNIEADLPSSSDHHKEANLAPMSLQDLFQEAEQHLQESPKAINNSSSEELLGSALSNHNSTVVPLTPSCRKDLFLLVMIASRVISFERRRAVRLSWGNPLNKVNKQTSFGDKQTTAWQVLFLIGKSPQQIKNMLVEQEHEKYKDVLRDSDYEDTYENLPKKVSSGIAWLSENCVPKYLLKSDDDVFVNVFQLIPWLFTLNSTVVYTGKVNWIMPVIRDPNHPNFVSRQDHPDDVYKPYCAGGGYILAGSVLKNITAASSKVHPIRNEDARMGMIIDVLGLKLQDDARFLPFIFYGPPLNSLGVCDWKDKFVIHGVSPRKQLVMHWNSVAMLRLLTLCEKL